jgi:hypothetical protein
MSHRGILFFMDTNAGFFTEKVRNRQDVSAQLMPIYSSPRDRHKRFSVCFLSAAGVALNHIWFPIMCRVWGQGLVPLLDFHFF